MITIILMLIGAALCFSAGFYFGVKYASKVKAVKEVLKD